MIQTFEIGSFAGEIAAELSRDGNCVRTQVRDNDYGALPIREDSDLYLCISDHLCFDLCLFLEDAAFARNKRFLPVIVDHPFLTVGPLFEKGHEGCFHCYYERFMQHNESRQVSQAINDYYSSRIGDGPKGYHPSDVSMVANWLRYLTRYSLHASQGRLVRMNLATRESLVARTIGVDGCIRCGLGRDVTTRSYSGLAEALHLAVH